MRTGVTGARNLCHPPAMTRGATASLGRRGKASASEPGAAWVGVIDGSKSPAANGGEKHSHTRGPGGGFRPYLTSRASARKLRKTTLAEGGGFEPPVGFYSYGALAKRCFRPLSHPSGAAGRSGKRPPAKVQGHFSPHPSSCLAILKWLFQLLPALGHHPQPDFPQVKEAGKRLGAELRQRG